MTKEQRVQLARDIEEILRKEWGKDFKDSDVISIYDYCMDEATTNDVRFESIQYEMMHG